MTAARLSSAQGRRPSAIIPKTGSRLSSCECEGMMPSTCIESFAPEHIFFEQLFLHESARRERASKALTIQMLSLCKNFSSSIRDPRRIFLGSQRCDRGFAQRIEACNRRRVLCADDRYPQRTCACEMHASSGDSAHRARRALRGPR